MRELVECSNRPRSSILLTRTLKPATVACRCVILIGHPADPPAVLQLEQILGPQRPHLSLLIELRSTFALGSEK